MYRLTLIAAVFVALAAGGASTAVRAQPAVVEGRIAFAMRSDLFMIRPNGSGLRRLTRGVGDDNGPAWSPDGRWIAFYRTTGDRKRSDVYVVGEAGGQPRLLVRGAWSPSWSPSGRRLAVFRSSGLWTVAFGGGKPRLVSAGAWSGDWAPSGNELAVMRADGIWIMRDGSGAARQLSSMSDRRGGLDWSPDGTRLLLSINNSLVALSTVDGSMTTLVAPPAAPAPTDPRYCAGSVRGGSWSPNGQWIAYEHASCVLDGGVRDYSWSIPILRSDGRWQTEIDTQYWGDNPYDIGTINPVWSPDSRFLAFIDDEEVATGHAYLATAAITETSYRRLKADVYNALAWR